MSAVSILCICWSSLLKRFAVFLVCARLSRSISLSSVSYSQSWEPFVRNRKPFYQKLMSWLGSCEENDKGRTGKVVSVYDTKAYGGSRGIAPLILNLGASRDGQHHAAAALFLRKKNCIHWIGGLVRPTAGLDKLLKKKTSCPCQDVNPGPHSR